jgi:membrane fusion protein, multidrug efflux system
MQNVFANSVWQRITYGSWLMAFLLVACQTKEAPPPAAPPTVDVAEVGQQDVPVFRDWVAQLTGRVNADITPKVQGYLLVQNYRDGYFVKKDELLFEIDSRPFVAALDQAKAGVAVANAKLSEADTNVSRDTPLAQQSAIPQKQLDTDLATQAACVAQVQAAKAQMTQAELNLSWTKVYAPFDGIAGVANVGVGDLVGPGTKLTVMSLVDPIRANFNISENDYLYYANQISRAISGREREANNMKVEFIQTNGDVYPQKGKISVVNREVTSQTGTIQLSADFANKEGILRPGGFGSIRIETGVNKNAMVIPQQAVIEVQSMYQVVVITPDNKAHFRAVKVGERVGNKWIIQDGLKPGDKVAVQGFMKVRDGMQVTTRPYEVTSSSGNS